MRKCLGKQGKKEDFKYNIDYKRTYSIICATLYKQTHQNLYLQEDTCFSVENKVKVFFAASHLSSYSLPEI